MHKKHEAIGYLLRWLFLLLRKLRVANKKIRQQEADIALIKAERDFYKNDSITDPLTGLYNRRYLEMEAQRLREMLLREKEPQYIVTIVADLDNFSHINNRFGHSTGDEVLRQIGTLFMKLTRASDICARYGGDEIVILASASTEEMANEIGLNVHERLSRIRCTIKTFSAFISASVGWSTCEASEFNLKTEFEHADMAMYQCKQQRKAAHA